MPSAHCLLIFLTTLAMAPPLLAQSAPADLLRIALADADQQKNSLTRFTYFDLDHLQNRNDKGKLYLDRTLLYEDTWIADLPYKRLIEHDGKPLAGRDLAQEQARYDQAVAERTGLDAQARARLLHTQSIELGIHLDDALTPAYRITELPGQTVDDHSTRVLVATSTILDKTFHFWITADQVNPTLLRLTIDIDADQPNLLHGSRLEKDFQLIDGISVVRHTLIHSYYPLKGKTLTIDAEHTYTRYRRFSATARILPE